jgi:hypothetical protein
MMTVPEPGQPAGVGLIIHRLIPPTRDGTAAVHGDSTLSTSTRRSARLTRPRAYGFHVPALGPRNKEL